MRAQGVGTDEQVIIIHVSDRHGPVEVARHLRATPGSPQINDDHFGGPSTKQPDQYRLRPRNQAEREFLAIGDGARVWLGEAAAAGTQKIRAKMDAAVTMAKVAGNTRVDWALGHAAVNGRFAHNDLASILKAHPPATTRRATESRSLAQATSGWARISPPASPAAADGSGVVE